MTRTPRPRRPPKAYVADVLCAMVPRLTTSERALIVAAYIDGIDGGLVGEALALGRKHNLRKGHIGLVALLKDADQKRRAKPQQKGS